MLELSVNSVLSPPGQAGGANMAVLLVCDAVERAAVLASDELPVDDAPLSIPDVMSRVVDPELLMCCMIAEAVSPLTFPADVVAFSESLELVLSPSLHDPLGLHGSWAQQPMKPFAHR